MAVNNLGRISWIVAYTYHGWQNCVGNVICCKFNVKEWSGPSGRATCRCYSSCYMYVAPLTSKLLLYCCHQEKKARNRDCERDYCFMLCSSVLRFLGSYPTMLATIVDEGVVFIIKTCCFPPPMFYCNDYLYLSLVTKVLNVAKVGSH